MVSKTKMPTIKKNLLITLDFPPIHGGVATYYYNVCQNLPADKIVVIAPEDPNALKFDQLQNFPIIRKNLANLKPSPRILKALDTIKWASAISYLEKVVKNHRIEMIQVGQILPLGTVALALKMKKKIPYVIYAHGLDVAAAQKFERKKRLIKKIIKHADGIVANSNFTKNEIVQLGADPDKVIVVYPCPNLEPEQASEVTVQEVIKNYHLQNKKIILTVGRLVERKGQDMVIKAMPLILKRVPNAIYVIVGTGPDKKRLETLAGENKLGEYVKFVGTVPNKYLAAFYELCDVFIMPNRQLKNGDVEGFGISFLEANAFGKPVIGGRSGGAPEAILDGRTGLLVSPENVLDVAEKTSQLLLDKSTAVRLGMQGLERVTDFFDWRIQTEKIKEILK